MCLPFFDELNAGFPTLRPSEFSEGHSRPKSVMIRDGTKSRFEDKSVGVLLIGVSLNRVG